MIRPFSWGVFFALLVAALFGGAAILPYRLGLARAAAQPPPTPTWPQLIPGQCLTLILSALTIGIGLWLASRIGLGMPILEAALRGEPAGRQFWGQLPVSILLGVAAGLLVVNLDSFLFQPALAAQLGEEAAALATAARQPAWKGFLASIYGGINEEILLRLFVMSLLAWLGHVIFDRADSKPTLTVLWSANVLAAVVSGLAHLPSAAAFLPLTPLVIARALVLNGIVGIACGWLYMRHGLGSAMEAHFSTGIVRHVIFGI